MKKRWTALMLAACLMVSETTPVFAETETNQTAADVVVQETQEMTLGTDETEEIAVETIQENCEDSDEIVVATESESVDEVQEDMTDNDQWIETEPPEVEMSEIEAGAMMLEEDEAGEEAAVNAMAAFDTATSLSFGKEYKGSTSESVKERYYSFTLPSSGKIQLSMQAKFGYYSYRVYDEKGDRVKGEYCYKNNLTGISEVSDKIYLTKGKYYFSIEAGSEYGDYSFNMTFTTANESFVETGNGTNNTYQTANLISANTSYKGMLAENDKIDYYKFTIGSSGRIKLSMSADMYDISYCIYDSNLNEIYRHTLRDEKELYKYSAEVDLTKGTYYLKFGNDISSTGTYSFAYQFTSANESFIETGNGTNNDIYSANVIQLEKPYKGQIASNDSIDYYKFTLTKAAKVTFKSTADMEQLKYTLYDKNGKSLWYEMEYDSDITRKIQFSKTSDLNAGTYYLAISKSFYYTGNYTLTLSTHAHSYKTVVTKATLTKNGQIVKKCSCGAVQSTTTIQRPSAATLSKTSYTYDGKAKKPTVTVKDVKGKAISASNYTVTYDSGCKNVGQYTVKIVFKGNYSGTLKKTFTIVPKSTTLSSLSAKSKGFKVSWKKQSSQTSGYQIQYGTASNFSGAKTITVDGNSKTSYTVSKLTANKKYYVRIRIYKTVSGKKYYSDWSGKKNVTTKK